MGPFSMEFSTNKSKKEIAKTSHDVSSLLTRAPLTLRPGAGQVLSWWGWGDWAEVFTLVYQLKIGLKILKEKIFWNYPVPFIVLFLFFFNKEGE